MLAACTHSVDPDQARVCRRALPAIEPAGTRIVVTGVAPSPQGTGVRMEYRAERESHPAVPHVAVCRFAEPSWRGKAELTELATDRGPIAGSALYLLKRFYIDTPDAAADDPGPPVKSPDGP